MLIKLDSIFLKKEFFPAPTNNMRIGRLKLSIGNRPASRFAISIRMTTGNRSSQRRRSRLRKKMIREVGLIGYIRLQKTKKPPKKQYATTQISLKAQSLDANEIPVRIFAWGFHCLWVIACWLVANDKSINQHCYWMDGVQEQRIKPPCHTGAVLTVKDKIVSQYRIIHNHHNQIAISNSRSYSIAQPSR